MMGRSAHWALHAFSTSDQLGARTRLNAMTSAGSSPRRVLVVDDEIMVRNLVCRLLAMEGYEVLEAEDGQAAIDLVRKDEPDLVLLDVMLPSRDGLDVLSELRRTTNVPIILVSAL